MCLKCKKDTGSSVDQGIALVATFLGGYVTLSPVLITVFILPWALPLFAAGATYLHLKKRTCKCCGTRFNIFPEGK